jgi:chromosome segregation ATPase
MFPRLAFLIICLGLIGAALLALRQARLQAASEAAQAQLRIAAADEELFALRSEVAAKVTPSAIEKLASSLHPLRPATNELPTEIAKGQAELAEAELAQAELAKEAEEPRGRIIKPGDRSGSKPSNKKPAKKPNRVARGE